MATKEKPGEFDCYANAKPDEPMFVLLARDVSAPWLVAAWAALRQGDLDSAQYMMKEAYETLEREGKLQTILPEKYKEAIKCGFHMLAWKTKNPDV